MTILRVTVGSLVVFAISVVADPVERAAARKPVTSIRIDPTVELMTIVFRLAGNWEYQQMRFPEYGAAIDSHFVAYRNHPAIDYARHMQQERGISFNAPITLAVHLDAEHLDPRVPLDLQPTGLDDRWMPAEATEFLARLQRFRDDSGFTSFFASHSRTYDVAAKRLESVLDRGFDQEWFRSYFGELPQADFQVIAGIGLGGMNFGTRVLFPDGSMVVHAVIGVANVDDEGAPVFGNTAVSKVVHEFSHSFVNPVVLRHAPELVASGNALLAASGEEMAHYGRWEMVIEESIVRALSIRQSPLSQPGAEGRAIRAEEQEGFFWMEEVNAALSRYESSRDRYRSFSQFVPELVKVFKEVGAEAEALVSLRRTRLDSLRPRVISVSVPDGSHDVDPNLDVLIIEFDRPMFREGYGLLTQGGSERAPDLSNVDWDESGRIAKISIHLKPNVAYSFWLNTEHGGPFMSEDGAMLGAFPLRFATGSR
ncbi:MAG: DUF4932 domain-containing protein [Candidatus Krumholzibacteria bacterium]|nr:DUF4932 domain-containing protein [Candidatus Krumholzibacteria bacterium]